MPPEACFTSAVQVQLIEHRLAVARLERSRDSLLAQLDLQRQSMATLEASRDALHTHLDQVQFEQMRKRTGSKKSFSSPPVQFEEDVQDAKQAAIMKAQLSKERNKSLMLWEELHASQCEIMWLHEEVRHTYDAQRLHDKFEEITFATKHRAPRNKDEAKLYIKSCSALCNAARASLNSGCGFERA